MTNEEIKQRIEALKKQLNDYEDLSCDLENDEYVARGNGFCDTKYSEDFVERRLQSIREEIARLEKMS